MKTMIRNGIVVPMNRNMDVWPDGYVVFEGSKILEAGPVDGLEAAIILANSIQIILPCYRGLQGGQMSAAAKFFFLAGSPFCPHSSKPLPSKQPL